jgi:hypothetical protein
MSSEGCLKKLLSLDPRVLKRLKQLERDERIECLLALVELADTFGQPHRHSGISIRKLGEHLFECRGNLALRFLFESRPEDLFVFFLGNHDEVRKLLRSGDLG